MCVPRQRSKKPHAPRLLLESPPAGLLNDASKSVAGTARPALPCMPPRALCDVVGADAVCVQPCDDGVDDYEPRVLLYCVRERFWQSWGERWDACVAGATWQVHLAPVAEAVVHMNARQRTKHLSRLVTVCVGRRLRSGHLQGILEGCVHEARAAPGGCFNPGPGASARLT